MAKLSADELIVSSKELTLLELSDFVKKFEEVFEVTAAAPVAVAAAGAPAAGGADAAAEQDEFDVVLGVQAKKIQVIKVVREVVAGLGLKEAGTSSRVRRRLSWRRFQGGTPRPPRRRAGRGWRLGFAQVSR